MAITNTTHNITDILLDGENLRNIVASLRARQDSITTALSTNPGDYQTEIIDARADYFGQSHASAGNNIRSGQEHLYGLILEKFQVLQKEYDDLSAAVLNIAALINTGSESEQ